MASSGFEPGERLSSGGYRYPDHYTIQLHLGYYQSYDLSRELAHGHVRSNLVPQILPVYLVQGAPWHDP